MPLLKKGLPTQPHEMNLETTAYLPVPVRFDVCGLLLALSAAFNVPVRVPFAVGLKTTLILQLAFAAKLLVHVVDETLKSPVVEITILVSATL